MVALQSPAPEEAAIAGLVELGEPAVELLLDALKEWKWAPHRKAAARALGQLGEPAVEPLIAVVKGGDGEAGRHAAKALGEIGDPRALEPLLVALHYEDRKGEAAEALGQLGEPALGSLLAALNDPSTDYLAAYALGKMGDPRAVDPLIDALKDQDFPSEHAARALGQIGDLRAVEPLLAVMGGDLRSGMWTSAVSALVQIGEDDPSVLLPFLEEASTVEVYHALIRLGDPTTVSALITAFRDYGDEWMAERYLNCGNEALEAEAQRWAKRSMATE